MLLMAMGRTLYKNNQFDMLQFAPWLGGVSGTGKTIVRKVMQSYYDKSTRTQLGGKTSEGFGMEKLPGKSLILWKDVGKLGGGKPFPVSAAEIKNLIDGGEEMDVNKKGIAAVDEDVNGAQEDVGKDACNGLYRRLYAHRHPPLVHHHPPSSAMCKPGSPCHTK
eukprot:COSAG04_NODE_5871_length_1467_cov_1.707602_1_plen_164_part_00